MKRFTPDTKPYHEVSWGYETTYYEAVMRESKGGGWVPFKNAHDAVQMLTKQNVRLEARCRQLESELFLLQANIAI